MRLRRSSEFRSIYASGVWVAGSPTEFRILFLNNEPVENETDETDPTKNVREEPHYQAEIIMTRPLAEWLRTTLDAFLKQTEVKTN